EARSACGARASTGRAPRSVDEGGRARERSSCARRSRAGVGLGASEQRSARAADGPPDKLGGRPSARALTPADGAWGHRKRAARAEHARALDGPPEAFDGLAASLYGWAVNSLAMASATVGGVGRVPVPSGTFGS